jgi:hypothetical protein
MWKMDILALLAIVAIPLPISQFAVAQRTRLTVQNNNSVGTSWPPWLGFWMLT